MEKWIIDWVKCPNCGCKFPADEEHMKSAHKIDVVPIEEAKEMVGLISDFLNGSVGLYEHQRMREIVEQYDKC